MIGQYIGFLYLDKNDKPLVALHWEKNFMQMETIRGDHERAVVVNEMYEDYTKNKDNIAKKAWERIKEKEEFAEFIKEVKLGGLDIDQLEVIYTPAELTKFYTDWKLTGLKISSSAEISFKKRSHSPY